MSEIKIRQAHPSNYAKGRSGQAIKYIVLHYTANDGDTAAGNCNYFAGAGRKASAHYFVDQTSVWQSVQDTDTAWHCGGKLQGIGGHAFYGICKNTNSIGVELCSRIVNGRYVIADQTQANAVQLVRGLIQRHNVPLENVIRHYDVTGKICPKPFVDDPAQWVTFEGRLTDALAEQEDEDMEKYKKLADVPQWGREAIEKVIEKGGLAPEPNGNINLTESMLRIYVGLYRMGRI